MADTYIPDDLRDTSQPDTDKNYFKIVVTDLNPGEVYPIQFRWQYEDKTYSDWSASKSFTTASEVALNAPQFLSGDVTNDGSTLVVKWSGLDSSGNAYPSNLDRVDIYINGGTYGASYVKAGDSFKTAGTKVIAVGTGTTYYVKLKAVSKSGVESNFSTERSATTVAQIVVDTIPPTNPTSISATAEVDQNDQTGFSLKATFSFTKSSDTSCRGYRIRWTTQTVSPVYEYAFVEHPSSGSTVSYTATGLIPNITYYYQVAAVDELNNTQAYSTAGTFSAQDSVATAEGSLARLKSYISIGGATGDQFKFGTGISESINISTNTTPSLSAGTYHGIVLNKTGNKNNYLLTTGQFRVGSDTQFMYFDANNLYLTGDINAASGKFSGNILMSSSNASLYNISNGYSIESNGTLPAGSTGFALNATGLQFKVAGSEKITLDASNGNATFNGTMTASSAVLNGSLTTTGTVDSFTGNTLTISGGSISADKVIKLNSLNASSNGLIYLVSDYLEINAETEITGAIQLSGNTLFNGAYNQIDRNTEIGGISTKNIRNIWIRNTLISATSSDGYIGDVWLQYS
jgi:chitin-binding protein